MRFSFFGRDNEGPPILEQEPKAGELRMPEENGENLHEEGSRGSLDVEEAIARDGLAIVESLRENKTEERADTPVEAPEDPAAFDKYIRDIGLEIRTQAEEKELLDRVSGRQEKAEADANALGLVREEFANLEHFRASVPGARLESWVFDKYRRLRQLERQEDELSRESKDKVELGNLESGKQWYQREIFYHAAPAEARYLGELASGQGKHEQAMRQNFSKKWGIAENEVSRAFAAFALERAESWNQVRGALFSEQEQAVHGRFVTDWDHLEQIKDPQKRVDQLRRIVREQAKAGNFFAAEVVLPSILWKGKDEQAIVTEIAFEMLKRGAPLSEASELVRKYVKDRELHDQAMVELWERYRGMRVRGGAVQTERRGSVPAAQEELFRDNRASASGNWRDGTLDAAPSASAGASSGESYFKRFRKFIEKLFRAL